MLPISTNGIIISWTEQNGRTRDLADALELSSVFIHPRRPLLVRYVLASISTIRLMYTYRNLPFVVMLPPTPLMLCSEIARRLFRVKVLYDLHTGFFHDPKWAWASGLSLRLMRGALCIVTNDNLAKTCVGTGSAVIVLHDVMKNANGTLGSATDGEQYVVFPASYSNDEPISEILGAARLTPDTKWILTGKAPDSVRKSAPPNVFFTGFLSEETFNQVLASASAVLALTTRDDTMQRAGYEALMHGTPVITSDFSVLRSFFEGAAVFVKSDSQAISAGVNEALRRRAELRNISREILNRRIAEQERSLDSLRSRLSQET